jgi:hypothetical protein
MQTCEWWVLFNRGKARKGEWRDSGEYVAFNFVLITWKMHRLKEVIWFRNWTMLGLYDVWKWEKNTCCNFETGFREFDYSLLPSTRLCVHLGICIWQYSMNFMFMWPCIVTNPVIKPTRSTDFSILFWKWNSTCFGQFLCPSSGVIRCTLSNGVCHTGL